MSETTLTSQEKNIVSEENAQLDTESGLLDTDEPTEHEIATLRHVSDSLPKGVYLVAAVVAAERFVFFGLTTPLQNYMQNPLGNDSGRPGALGLGQAHATSLYFFFSFLTFLSPIIGAVIADGWLGRYRTIIISSGIYLAGLLLLFLTALPVSLQHGAGLGGLITAMLLIGAGVGGFKSSVNAFIADQYTETKMRVITLKKGEKVIVDRDATIQSIYSIYYWCVSSGAFSIIAVSYLEKKVGFWAAFLFPFCILLASISLFVLCSKWLVKPPPHGTLLIRALKIVGHAISGGFKMDKARPAHLAAAKDKVVPWDDSFVDEIQKVLIACRVFLPWPLLWLCQQQVYSTLISMAANMNTHGFPNDFIRLINPVSILILLPIVNYFMYPTLRRLRIPFPPVSRMIFGFTVETLAMAYAGVTQHLVYSSGPCYSHPRACPAAMTPNGAIPNNINVFVQVPVYVIEGFGDMFCVAAGYEYAYQNSPVSMKTLVPAVFMLTATVGTLLGLALTPLYQDPRLVTLFILLASLMGTVTALTWIWQRRQKSKEEKSIIQGANDATASADSVSTAVEKEVEKKVEKEVPSEKVEESAEDRAVG